MDVPQLWILALYILTFIASTEQSCSEEQFSCASLRWRGDCIPLVAVCDGRAGDCDDGSDETHCGAHRTCPKLWFACASGRCLPPAKICDGEHQCPDGSDETHCGSINITGPGLQLTLDSFDFKIYNYKFNEMHTNLLLTCAFKSLAGKPLKGHVLKMRNEFGSGSTKLGKTVEPNTHTMTVSHRFKINAKSKTIYCTAVGLKGHSYLSLVNLVYEATPTGTDCNPNYNVKQNSLVVIRNEEHPPPLWLVGFVKKVFPKNELDGTSFSVAEIVTREGVMFKGFDVLCSLP